MRTKLFSCVSLLTLAIASGSALAAPHAGENKALIQKLVDAQADSVLRKQHQARQALLRARTSGNPQDTAQAEFMIQEALNLNPQNGITWGLKAWAEMNRHEFSGALASAQKAQQLLPGEPVSLGIASDALTELGQYPQAVAATQRMVDSHPALPAFARAAYLRFLHGDTQGAILLMKDAVAAGNPKREETAWALLQLSELYLQNGQTEAAWQAASAAATHFPKLGSVDAALAHVKLAQNNLDEAARLFKRAFEKQVNPDTLFAMWQIAVFQGRVQDAARHAKLLDGIAKLDETNGRLFRRTFAMVYAERPGQAAYAEQLARAELAQRPDIYSYDALAWALYRGGKIKEAQACAEKALALGTQDARINVRAGLILADSKRGQAIISEALTRYPNADLLAQKRFAALRDGAQPNVAPVR